MLKEFLCFEIEMSYIGIAKVLEHSPWTDCGIRRDLLYLYTRSTDGKDESRRNDGGVKSLAKNPVCPALLSLVLLLSVLKVYLTKFS